MKAGVIGVGTWGARVAKEYIALKEEKLIDSVMLCDQNDMHLKPFAETICTSNSIGETLSRVDMIHICTPNSTHYEISKKALKSGVNVLIEKPMAEDVTHAYDLVELSTSKGLILQVGHLFRFANIVRKIKHLVESNELGEVYYFNMSWTHQMPPIDNVDVIFDLLSHPLDIINFITGKWPIDFHSVSRLECPLTNAVSSLH